MIEQLKSAPLDVTDLEVLVAHLQQRLQTQRDQALGGGKLVWVEPTEGGWLVRRSLWVCGDNGTVRLDGPFDYSLTRTAEGKAHWRMLGRTEEW